MRSQLRGDGVCSPVSPPSRSSSISSSVGSATTARFTLIQPPHIELAPAYVAAAAASELVSQLRIGPRRGTGDDASAEERRTAIMTEDALVSLNYFLDFLVFNILALARSSALDPIRAAVEHIVKGRLGKQAVKSGENELEELINEDDETGLQDEHTLGVQWDADLVWRRTRLKIMTYMRLSEVEDDDEEDGLEEELAQDESQRTNRFSQRAGLFATIFLTSALERIAEQCIKDASEGAYNRISVSRPGTRDGFQDEEMEYLVVTEQDVKKLALSQLVGRLWRQWKHTLPRPTTGSTASPFRTFHERTLSNTSDVRGAGSRRPSNPLRPIHDTSLESKQREHTADSSLQVVHNPKSPRPISDQTANRRAGRHAPRRSRSFGRFPVAVPGRGRTEAGSWQAEPSRLSRMRSSSLPPPTFRTSHLSVSNRSEDEPASASTSGPSSNEKRASRHSQRSEMSTSAANSAVRAAEADVVAASGKRLSREARRSIRISQDIRRSMVEPVQGATPDLTVEQIAEPNTEPAEETATTSAPDEDDEYDPFRADAPVPRPAKAIKPHTDPKSAVAAPPVQDTLRTMSQRDSVRDSREVSPQRIPDATTGLAGGAVSSAILGTTSQRKAKKPAPLDMAATTAAHNRGHRVDTEIGDDVTTNEPHSGGVAGSQRSDTRDVTGKPISPAQTSADRVDESRTPSSSKLQRMATPDTGSATYETPRGSPSYLGGTGEIEDRSPTQPRTSDPYATVPYAKPTSSKQKRGLPETAPQKPSIRTSDIPRETEKTISPSARSDKEFNELMSGNGTVKRTLTPRQLTEIEAVDSPRLRQEQVRVGPPSPVGTKYPIGESRPAPESRESSSSEPSQRLRKTSNIGAIRQAAEAKVAEGGPSSSPKPSRNGYLVKDAREQTYRTNDMADFIRSTGPTSPDQAPRLVNTAISPGKAPKSPKSPKSPSNYPKAPMKAVVPNTSRLAQKKKTGSFRPERQANDDLINFLKEGPPGAHVTESRSMDTETGLGAISPANRSSSQMSQSINESVNSHSALLSKHNVSSAPPERSAMNTSASRTSPMPKPVDGGVSGKKRYRNKDPYAIDLEDEDEDILTSMPPKEEQSDTMGLVDFLKSTPPPEDNFPSGPRNRVCSPPPSAPLGTSSTATGGPRPLHKPIPSNEEIKKDPRSDLALPHFLKEDRQVRPRQSYDSNHSGRSGRKSGRSSEPGRGGMRGLFKRIGVNG